MSVNPLSNFSQVSSVTAGGNGAANVADNFNSFLQILTTQLKNQNPLEPLDTHQFTQQLVQFSSVEQAVKQNDQLETLNKLISASLSANAVSYIDSQITASGTVNQLRNGKAEWIIDAGRAGTANVTIKDAGGNIVREETLEVKAGANPFTWDGTSTGGSALPDGQYSISVTGEDINGENISLETRLKARVDAVDFSTGEPVLLIGDMQVPMSLVESVSN